MNYIQRVYDLLVESIELFESGEASRKEKYRLKKKYGLVTRGTEDYDGDAQSLEGRAGEPGSGSGGEPQATVGRGRSWANPQPIVGAHSTGGDERGRRKVSGGPEHPGVRMVAQSRLQAKLAQLKAAKKNK